MYTTAQDAAAIESGNEEVDPLANEAVTEAREVGISIKHLTKIYGHVSTLIAAVCT